MWIRRTALGCGLAAVLVAGWSGPPPAVASISSGLVPFGGQLPDAAIPLIAQALPAAYDPTAGYEAQSQCDPSPKPGTLKLATLIRKTYGSLQVVGISRACNSGGTSEHKEGRALDWMTSARVPQGLANAKAFLSWLLGPDQFGTPNGNATRLGVMYIGWNDRYWAAYATDRGWTELKGCFSRPSAGSDTDCHRNHIHISLTWDGASGRTSMWDGTVLTPYCLSSRSDAVVLDVGRSSVPIEVPPVRVLSTRQGLGLLAESGDFGGWGEVDSAVPLGDTATPPLPVPCRVGQPDWGGGLGGIRTKVTGQGGVPETGVAAVAVTLTSQGSTAPANATAWGPGEQVAQVLAKVKMNGRGTGAAIVPVASDGTVALGTSNGASDFTLDVTGYYPPGDQPNVTQVIADP
jgi:hypothetical protein